MVAMGEKLGSDCRGEISPGRRGHRFDYVEAAGNQYYLSAVGRRRHCDQVGDQGGINPYQYVASGRMGNVDASGQRRISFAFDAFINGNAGGHWLPEPIPYLWVQFRTDLRGFGQFNSPGGPKGFGNARPYSYGWVNSCNVGHLAKGGYLATTADGFSENRRSRDDLGISKMTVNIPPVGVGVRG